MRQPNRPVPPLDPVALERLALRYVERFATSRGKLAEYLARKVRERGWAGDIPADPRAVAERMAERGYVDDRGYAEAKAGAMARRGLGARRVGQALHAAGIDEADTRALAPAIEAQTIDAALTFARRRRIGPWATAATDDAVRRKHLAAMLRAGHGFALARRIVVLEIGADVSVFYQESSEHIVQCAKPASVAGGEDM